MATAKRESMMKNFLDQKHRKHSSRKSRHPLRGHRQLVTLSEDELARREQGWNDRFSVDPPPKSNKPPSPLRSPTFSTPPTPLTKETKIRNERAQYGTGKRGRRKTREQKKPSSGRLVPLGLLSNPPAETAQSSKEEKLRFKVLKAIDARETLLYQLSALILCTPVQESLFLPSRPAEPPTSTSAGRQQMRSRGGMALASTPMSRHGATMTNAREATKLVQHLATDLQVTGIQCVEALVEWMLEAGAQAETPPPFLWRGRNYFLKMINDLDFAEAELQARGINLDCFKPRNPLLIKPNQKLGRVLAANSIISEMVEFAKNLTPKELLALSGRMRDSARVESDEVAENQTAEAVDNAADPKSETLLELGDDHAVDHHTAADLVDLLDESLDFIHPNVSREETVTQAEANHAHEIDHEEGKEQMNEMEMDEKQTNEANPEEEAADSTEENGAAEAEMPESNQSEEENHCANDDEPHSDEEESLQLVARQPTPPLEHEGEETEPEDTSENAIENEVEHEETKLNGVFEAAADPEQISARVSEDTNQDDYENSFDGEAADEVDQESEEQLPTAPAAAKPEESPEADDPDDPEDNSQDVVDTSAANPIVEATNSPENPVSSRTEDSNQDYDNSFDEDGAGLEESQREAAPSDTTRTTSIPIIPPIQGLQLAHVDSDNNLAAADTNEPESVSKKLTDELNRWSFLKDVNGPTEVNIQESLAWCSTRELRETLQKHCSIRDCLEGSIVSMLEQYDLAVPESPLQSVLTSNVAVELDLSAHLFEECRCLLDDICSVLADDIHRSLQSKSSLASEIEVDEVLELTEQVRQEYHESTWQYLKIATTLLAFLRPASAGTSTAPSTGLSRMVKVFYPYLVAQPREDLSENWHSMKTELAAMGVHVDELYFMLDPMCKTLLLAVSLSRPSTTDDTNLEASVIPKVTVICDREDVLQSTVDYVWQRHLSTGRPLSGFALFPFFKSSFGEKLVDGIQVEEGEGKGPLKEWFRLLGEQLTSRWKLVPLHNILSEPDSIQVTASGNAITIPGASDAVRAGFKIEWGTCDGETITRIVNKCVGDDTFLLDRSVSTISFSASQLRVFQPTAAFFEYVQASESYWLNENTRDSPESKRVLIFVGWVFASAITHFSSIQLKVDPLFFRLLLEPALHVSMEELRVFNPPLFNSLTGMKSMKPSDFADYLKFEGADEGLSVDDYIAKVLEEKFGSESGIGWQLDAVRQGFTRVIPIQQLTRIGIDSNDLAQIVYGSTHGGDDFAISEIFRVAADSDFTNCKPLADAFWHTVKSFEPQLKRKFVKFVTGVDTLPLPGTEFFRIEMPFTAISADDYAKCLQMLPQAHTCDNTLELPHYWRALCWREKRGESEANDPLEEELRTLLRKKLYDAVEYSSGYGLDGTSTPEKIVEKDIDLAKEESYDSLGLPALAEGQSVSELAIESSPPSPQTSDRYGVDETPAKEAEPSPVKPAAAVSPRPDESYDEYDWEEDDQ